MRFAILLTILSIASCASIPDRPKSQVCVIDYPRNEVICGKVGDEVLQRKPLKEMDSCIVFSPDDWYDIETYMDIVEDYFKQEKVK